MPGYAYPVGATQAEYPSRTINTTAVTEATLQEDGFTLGSGLILGSEFDPVAVKTRINSIFITNVSGGILPITVVRGQVTNFGIYDVVHSSRVFKSKYISLPLVSGDSRVGGDPDGEAVMGEITLAPGDFLAVLCPFNDALIATVNVSIGVK